MKKLYSLTLLACLLLSGKLVAQNIVPDSIEYAALKALYEATDGPNWKNNTNWLQGSTAANMGLWRGVTVVNGDVKDLNLSGLGLKGELPAEISNLTGLTGLNLYYNPGLTGQLPSNIGNCKKLNYIEISYTSISGPLPESLSEISTLNNLRALDTKISGSLPESLGQLNIKEFQVVSAYLTGEIPESYGNWTSAEIFHVGGDLFGKVPESFSQLASLQSLTLKGSLTGSLEMLKDLPNLATVNISDNHYETLPEFSQFANKENLKAVVRNNYLNYDELGKNLNQIKTFELLPQIWSRDTIYYVPGEPLKLHHYHGDNSKTVYTWWREYIENGTTKVSFIAGDIDTLNLTAHQLYDGYRIRCFAGHSEVGSELKHTFVLLPDSTITYNQVPDSVEYQALKMLFEQTGGSNWKNKTNWLSGDTSADFAGWYGIKVENGDISEIVLPSNNLVGTLPSLSALSKIRKLNLSNNSGITGTLDLYGLTNLNLLNLQSCRFSGGGIPMEALKDMRNLEYLNLQGAGLGGGSLPEGWENLPRLRHLNLTGNQVSSGGIPASIGQLKQLQELHMSNMKLSSVNLEVISELTKLKKLNLSYNRDFKCSIPESFGNLTQLTYLNMGFCGLRGELPLSLVKLTKMDNLYLGFNYGLSGEFPDYFCQWPNLRILNIHSNKFTGPFPTCLLDNSNLSQLVLTDNQFYGELPQDIGEYWNLNTFNIGTNNFEGTIPASLGLMSGCLDLRMDNNNLTGTVPEGIGNLKKLLALYLGNNPLEGTIPDSLGNIDYLRDLYLNNTNLTGGIPEGMLASGRLRFVKLENSNFTSLPDFSQVANPGNVRLSVQNNQLTFSDLEKQFTQAGQHPFYSFNYGPQQTSYDTVYSLSGKEPVNLLFEAGGTATDYSWMDSEGGIVGYNKSIIITPLQADGTIQTLYIGHAFNQQLGLQLEKQVYVSTIADPNRSYIDLSLLKPYAEEYEAVLSSVEVEDRIYELGEIFPISTKGSSVELTIKHKNTTSTYLPLSYKLTISGANITNIHTLLEGEWVPASKSFIEAHGNFVKVKSGLSTSAKARLWLSLAEGQMFVPELWVNGELVESNLLTLVDSEGESGYSLTIYQDIATKIELITVNDIMSGWNGRLSNGSLIPKGTYSYTVSKGEKNVLSGQFVVSHGNVNTQTN